MQSKDTADGRVVSAFLGLQLYAVGGCCKPSGRAHRCALEFALQVVDVMTSILTSGDTGAFVDIATTCDRPAALDVAGARDLMV